MKEAHTTSEKEKGKRERGYVEIGWGVGLLCLLLSGVMSSVDFFVWRYGVLARHGVFGSQGQVMTR